MNLLACPAAAEVYNTAGPSAAAVGNVSNQAYQFQVNGAPARQNFKGGNSCSGAVATISPFYTGNDVNSDPYVKNQNWGVQLSLMAPLDGSLVEMCKALARREIEKQRLDYELVRVKECIAIHKAGFMIHPESHVGSLCADVVEVAAYRKSLQASPSLSAASSVQR